MDVCENVNISTCAAVSRSGQGGHVENSPLPVAESSGRPGMRQNEALHRRVMSPM